MKELEEKQLKLEIDHIFDSGANEIRIFEMVKNFIEKRYPTTENDVLLTPKIISVIQSYPDKDDQKFEIGDETTDGKILEFKQTSDKLLYAITDKPSEWHLANGQNHGWNWVWMLALVNKK